METLSSCPCWNCEDKKYSLNQTGTPTNLSVTNCDEGDAFECLPRLPFHVNYQPSLEPSNSYTTLNPHISSQFNSCFGEEYNTAFQEIDCKGVPCKGSTYVSHDPRLKDPTRSGMILQLDKPPLNGQVPLKDVYSPKLAGYGKNYRTYSDIQEGQILYYINHSREDPYYAPNFTIRGKVQSSLYKDPMGSLKPQYYSTPLVNKNNRTGSTNYYSCLTWINDSASHREDLLARQMAKQNQERWEPRWYQK